MANLDFPRKRPLKEIKIVYRSAMARKINSPKLHMAKPGRETRLNLYVFIHLVKTGIMETWPEKQEKSKI